MNSVSREPKNNKNRREFLKKGRVNAFRCSFAEGEIGGTLALIRAVLAPWTTNRRALPDCRYYREVGPEVLSLEVDRIPWGSEPMRQNAENCFELLAQVAAS